MWMLLFLIPILTVASGVALYQKNGKREFLKFDVVQFVYAFILAPIGFVWFKSFLFFVLRRELELRLSLTELFVADTAYSVVFMFVYAFVVMHSLTKSFENKRREDPVYDVFKHSEAIHLWVSHAGIYLGVMVLLTVLSLVNIAVPVGLVLNKWNFYVVLLLGLVGGLLGCVSIWWSIFEEKYWRFIKLCFGGFLTLHIVVYFWWDPKFNASYLVFWFGMGVFWGLAIAAWFFDRSNRTIGWFERWHHKGGWSAKGKRFLLSK